MCHPEHVALSSSAPSPRPGTWAAEKVTWTRPLPQGRKRNQGTRQTASPWLLSASHWGAARTPTLPHCSRSPLCCPSAPSPCSRGPHAVPPPTWGVITWPDLGKEARGAAGRRVEKAGASSPGSAGPPAGPLPGRVPGPGPGGLRSPAPGSRCGPAAPTGQGQGCLAPGQLAPHSGRLDALSTEHGVSHGAVSLRRGPEVSQAVPSHEARGARPPSCRSRQATPAKPAQLSEARLPRSG